ncbi:MAG: hypothetical protein L6Q95_19185, partial [Planctomycetes bacterium]|nr:hypothetical protein [Planctomycetota bacterium]
MMPLVARDPSAPFVMRPDYGEEARYPSAVHVMRRILGDQVKKAITTTRMRTFFARVTVERRLALERVLRDRDLALLHDVFVDPTGYNLAQLRTGVFADARRARLRLASGPGPTTPPPAPAFWRVHDDKLVVDATLRVVSDGSLDLLQVFVPAFPDPVTDEAVFERLWPSEWEDDGEEAARRL